ENLRGFGKYNVFALITNSEGEEAFKDYQFHYWPNKGINVKFLKFDSDRPHYERGELVSFNGRIQINQPLEDFDYEASVAVKGPYINTGEEGSNFSKVEVTATLENCMVEEEVGGDDGTTTCDFTASFVAQEDYGQYRATGNISLTGDKQLTNRLKDSMKVNYYVGGEDVMKDFEQTPVYPAEEIKAPSVLVEPIEVNGKEKTERLVVTPGMKGIGVYSATTAVQESDQASETQIQENIIPIDSADNSNARQLKERLANNAFKIKRISTGKGVIDKEVTVSSEPEQNRLRIQTDESQATTTRELEFENEKLFIKSSTAKAQVKVMPEEAVSTANLGITNDVTLDLENNKPVYKVRKLRQARLFWFIPTEVTVEATVNAETGVLESTDKPWFVTLNEE
ncbi:MAG: hypothetical protein ABH821_03085, partial [archaeon]